MDEKNNDTLDDLEHDEFEEDIDPSDYFDNDDYCYECQGYGDDYQVDEDGDWVCTCDNCVHNSDNWEDGHWIGGDY